MKKAILILLLCVTNLSFANQDSLWSVWRSDQFSDTARTKAMHDFIWGGYLFTQPDTAYVLAQEYFDFANSKKIEIAAANALNIQGIAKYFLGEVDSALVIYKKSFKFFKRVNNLDGMANSLNNQGIIYYMQGEYDGGIKIYENCLHIRYKQNNDVGMAKALANMANLYYEKGNYIRSIELSTNSLKISEKADYKEGIASALNNIGSIYMIQNDSELGLANCSKAIDIYREINFDQGLIDALGNVATAHQAEGDYYNAKKKLHESILISKRIQNTYTLGQSYQCLANVFLTESKLDSARSYAMKAFEIAIEIGDPKIIVDSKIILAELAFIDGHKNLAISNAEEAFKISTEIQNLQNQKAAAELLYRIYKTYGNSTKSLRYYEKYVIFKDSLLSESNQKAILNEKYKYEYEKFAIADSIKSADAKKITDATIMAQTSQLKQEETQRYSLYGGLFLMVLFAGFIFNRFTAAKRQKLIIEDQKKKVEVAHLETEQQKHEIEEAHKEITDSIKYAKRIQSAILPPQKLVKKYLPKSFILYKPKDVVAGDFYWMKKIGNKTLIAAADCTGHGVPGALVSVVCNNGLNRSVREYGLTYPGDILDKTREIVIQEFEKSEEDVKDGMDIALCVLDGDKLQYAGANNPLWIIRNGEVMETKANKQPIGNFHVQTPFITHEIELQKNDSVYIFSDGYVDQFGGEKGKKFKAKSFRSLLLGIQDKTMDEQMTVIDNAFESWRGNLEQIDDVCVIGIKI